MTALRSRLTSGVFAMLVLAAAAPAQVRISVDFARRLADMRAREAAILSLRECPQACSDDLVKLAEQPPQGVTGHDLAIGVAELFGRLRVKAGIPFLIRHIMLDDPAYSYSPRIWTRLPTVAEARLPCLAALIRIGSEATGALIQAAEGPTTFDRRAALVHAISRIRDPRGIAYLETVKGELDLLRNLASGHEDRDGPQE